MRVVSSRLLTVPENRQIDASGLPSAGDLERARVEIDACLEFCREVGEQKEEMELGAAAAPDSGNEAAAPSPPTWSGSAPCSRGRNSG